MKSRNRELNIFSMSALDLFASAMGAFILIAFVLFPYFPNTGDAEEIAKLIQERDKLMGEKDKLMGEKDKLMGEKDKLIGERDKLMGERDKLMGERDKLIGEKDKLMGEKDKLIEEKDKLAGGGGKAVQKDSTSVLLGIKTIAKKFVIVVDMSGSIEEYRDFVKLSIQDMLSSFRTEIELVMIGFHGSQLHYWPENRQYFQVGRNTRNPVMTTINTWMGQVGGGTPTREALIAALALNPEEIILLSDGAPNEKWHYVVRTITSQNIQRIPIHAIAIGNYVEQRDFIDFLIQLTEQNVGYLVGAKPG